ncbi:MAG: hypothetical protein HZC55_26620 [Verrucomicrobia bacterium]|nr:hypothetical protein [Verrucomicrobiota bacterium]
MSGLTIVVDTAGPLLARVRSEAQRAGLALVGARAVAIATKAHLLQLDRERHRYGRHYYGQAARSVNTRAGGAGLALVTVSQTGIRQRLLGGPITPKSPRKFLTLPEAPEAFGKRAREFHDLDFQLVLDDRGALRPALVRRASSAISITRRRRKDGTVSFTVKPGALRGGEVIFWLARRVQQKPDPSVLPAETAMQETALDAIRRRVVRLETRAQGGTAP